MHYASSTNHTVVVTGAANGIGAAIAYHLLSLGHSVIAIDKMEVHTAGCIRTCREGVELLPIQMDLTNIESFVDLFTLCEQRGHTPSVLINNAAFYGYGSRHPVVETSVTEFDKIMATNFRAPFVLTQNFLDRYSGSGAKLVINVLTQVTRVPAPGRVAYAASKAALESFSLGLAAEVADEGISVVCIHPGKPVRTPGIENRRPPNYDYAGYLPAAIMNETVENIVQGNWMDFSGKILAPGDVGTLLPT